MITGVSTVLAKFNNGWQEVGDLCPDQRVERLVVIHGVGNIRLAVRAESETERCDVSDALQSDRRRAASRNVKVLWSCCGASSGHGRDACP